MLTFDKSIPNENFTKTKPFELLDNVFACKTRTSFLYLNTDYFTTTSTRPLRNPPTKINCAYLPPNYGCIAYEYLNGNIAPHFMEQFQKTYSLDNQNRSILRCGYLVGIDYQKMLEMLTSPYYEVRTNALLMMKRDNSYLRDIQIIFTAEKFLSKDNARAIYNIVWDSVKKFSTTPLKYNFPNRDSNYESEQFISEQIKSTNVVSLYQQFCDDSNKLHNEQINYIRAQMAKQQSAQSQQQIRTNKPQNEVQR